MRLVGKYGLRRAGDGEGIEKAGQDGEQHDEHQSGTELLQHWLILQASPAAETKRSISLMPTNGTIMPPRP